MKDFRKQSDDYGDSGDQGTELFPKHGNINMKVGIMMAFGITVLKMDMDYINGMEPENTLAIGIMIP